MDCLERIRTLLEERGWSVYRLAQEAGVPQSTLANLFLRNNMPTVPTLERICQALGITMAEFFSQQPTLPPRRSSPPSCWRSGPPFPRPKSAWCWSWSTSWGGPEKIFQNQGLTPPGKPGIINTRYGGIAQLVRAPASHVGGHRFESCCPHHKSLNAAALRLFSFSPA